MDRLGARHRRGATRRAAPTLALTAALLLASPGTAVAPTPRVRHLDCTDFATVADARAWWAAHRTLADLDPGGLDGDGDGEAC